MRIPETLRAYATPRSARVKSWHKRAVTVVATFFLATVFALVGAPVATAAPASMNNHVSSAGYSYCDGKFPGCCYDHR